MSEKLVKFVVLHDGLDIGGGKVPLKREEVGELPELLIPRLVELGAISVLDNPAPPAPKPEAKIEPPVEAVETAKTENPPPAPKPDGKK